MSQPEFSSSGAAPHCAFKQSRAKIEHVLACVNGDACTQAVLAHGAALAKALSARLTVIHVLELAANQEPMDPVEWTLHHYDKVEYLDSCLTHLNELSAEAVIVAGCPAARISDWAQEHDVKLIVLGRGAQDLAPSASLGDTARRVAECAMASVLLVPALATVHPPICYQKLLIPLDGSCRAECTLPLGLKVAALAQAKIVLLHAAGHIDLIERDKFNSQAMALRTQLYRHNEAAGQHYLEYLLARLPQSASADIRLLPSGDARQALLAATQQEQPDLVVLAAAGKSGHADMALGSVADYLIHRLCLPVLLVRHETPPSKPALAFGPDRANLSRTTGQGMQ